MKKVIVFLLFSVLCFSENIIAESKFINIGNMKIVREENIKIAKENENMNSVMAMRHANVE